MTSADNRNITVIAPHLSTGGAKYLSVLLSAILKLKPDYLLSIYEDIKEPYAKKLLVSELSPLGIKLYRLNSSEFKEKTKSRIKILNIVINKFRRKLYNRKQLKLNKLMLNKWNESDLLFCPWPYEYDCPNVNMPMSCITHDFNYMHHFGMNVYEFAKALKIRKQHEVWLNKSTPIVSSYFIAKELRKAFPLLEKEVHVVHLSKLSDFKRLADDKVDKILIEVDINFDFVLSANNNTYHKNYNLLYAGYYYFKQKYPKIRLIMIGWGTEDIEGVCNNPNYIDLFKETFDVKGLGLVKDEVLMALMQRAKMVINTSLYEAGNGSGLDAWGLGTPVVMSNIEPFVEQMDALGVKAQTFDPKDAKDIANAMSRILEHPEQTQKDVQDSLAAINKYSWKNVAQKYINIFENSIVEYKK